MSGAAHRSETCSAPDTLKVKRYKEKFMKILWGLAAAAGVLLSAAVLEIYRELHCFSITHYDVTSRKLRGAYEDIRIVFLSDLHNRVYGKHNRELLDAVRQERPDLILIGGDMLVGKPGASYDLALDLVARLTAFCPVYYALGNHEGRMKVEPDYYGNAWPEYKKRLEKCGVIFLENTSEPVSVKGQQLVLSGLELPAYTYKKFRKAGISGSDIQRYLPPFQSDAVSSRPSRDGTGSAAKMAEDGSGSFFVLLAHNPAYVDACLEWGADLILSGHLHGGLVRIPGIGGVITPQGFMFPKYSGEMTRTGDQTVIVSRGLGTHTVNIRLFNIPELISIRLKKSL